MFAKNSRLSSSTSWRRRSISALPSLVGERRPNSSTSRSSELIARCRSRSLSRGVCAAGSAVTTFSFSLPLEFPARSASFAAAFQAFLRSRRRRSRSRSFSLFATESVTERVSQSCLLNQRDRIGAADFAHAFDKFAIRAHRARRFKRCFGAVVLNQFKRDATTAGTSCKQLTEPVEHSGIKSFQIHAHTQKARRAVVHLIQHSRTGNHQSSAHVFDGNAALYEQRCRRFQNR